MSAVGTGHSRHDAWFQMRFRQTYVVGLAFLILLGAGYHFFGLFIPATRPQWISRNLGGGYAYGNDLYPIWLSSGELLLRGHTPYTAEVTAQIETGLYGRPLDRRNALDAQVNYRAFSYPLYTVFFVAPLAPLSFPAVQVVLSVLLPLLAATSVFLWLAALGTNLSRLEAAVAVCLTLASYPVLDGIYAGQPSLLVGALLAGALAALARTKLVPAGVLLACASIKPHLILLVMLWMMVWAASAWRSRKNLIVSFVAIMLLLLAASELLAPGWFAGWMHALREYRQISPPALGQFVLGRVLGGLVSLALLLMSARLCWLARRQPAASPSFAVATVFVLMTTVVVLPSTIAVYDQCLLLPVGIWLYAHRARILNGSLPLRFVGGSAVAALAWHWLSACGVVLVRFLWPSLAHAPQLLLLPLRTAASVPFALLALLYLITVLEIKDQSGSGRFGTRTRLASII